MIPVRVGDKIAINMEDWGNINNKPVLFIHGWPQNHKTFEYQFMHLSQNGYRCIGIDLRGFGRSDGSWSEYNYDIFADDIKDVIDILNITDITLVGFSMGGAIAMHYISKYFSERVSKVVFMGAAAPCFTKREGFPYGLEKSDCDRLIAQSIEDRPKMLSDFGRIFFEEKEGIPISQDTVRWLHQIGMEASPYATIKCLEVLRDADLRSDMMAVKDRNIPVAIFHGSHDKICPFDLAREMHKGIPQSRLVEFTESGHGLNIQEKAKTNEELMKFIG